MRAIEDEVLSASRIATLYRGARPAYATTLANAAILVAVLWGATPGAALTAWYAAVLAVTLARLASFEPLTVGVGHGDPLTVNAADQVQQLAETY